MLYRFYPLGSAFPEAFGPFLAQAETIYEKSMQVADKFGNANDSVRFGIVTVALFVLLGALAYLYIAFLRATIKKTEDRNAELEKEIRANRVSYETKYDELRDDCKREIEGYKGLMTMAVHEIGRNNQWLQQQGYVPRPTEPPPIMLRPPIPAEPPSRASQFLPQTRRIPPKPFGGNRNDPKEEDK